MKLAPKSFVPFLMAGDPDLATTEACASALIEGGAAALEIGLPFSDPVADGPVLQLAAERALKVGTTAAKVLELVSRLRARHPSTPLVLFTYFNPLLAYGLERLVRDAKAAGVTALLVVDLPPEESDELCGLCAREGLENVFLASPTTSDERLREVGRRATGFVYVVARAGVTGARDRLPAELARRVEHIRRLVDRPLAVGFGVSSGAQAVQVARMAEGVVVGSALVERIAQAQDKQAAVEASRSFAREIRSALEGDPS
jgi:tryptophan synthase alpha chain